MDQMEKNVSVIIPTYNRARVLNKTIPSYLQEVTLEVILVDDGSVDETREYVRRLHRQYHEIKYIRLNKNKGIAYARNAGVSKASGKYIYFGDDDACLYPGTLFRLRNALETFSADIAGANGSYATKWDDIRYMDRYIKSQFTEPMKGRCLMDFDTGETNYHCKIEKITEGLFVMACFMIRTELARSEKLDAGYTKKGGWEDIGYLLQHAEQGRREVYVPDAYEIDLPKYISKGGGCTGKKLSSRFIYIVWNWHFLLNKHYDYLKREKYISISKTKSMLILIKQLTESMAKEMLEMIRGYV